MNKKEKKKERKETLIRSIDSKWYMESEIIQSFTKSIINVRKEGNKKLTIR